MLAPTATSARTSAADPRTLTTISWQEKSASHWLNVCRDCTLVPGQLKTAELGGGQDVPFENAFSNLAHSYLRDKAPKLMDYEVGFQLIEKAQDNTKAVGTFGFKIGSSWIFAPVFFLNGDLKGHELLYVKHQDMFVPLKEEWVNYLLGRKPSILGEGVNRNLSMVGVMPPNLAQMNRSPGKFASAGDACDTPKLAKWAAAVLPDLAYFGTTDPFRDPKYASLRRTEDLLKEGGMGDFRFILEKLAHFPLVVQAFDRLLGTPTLDGVAAFHKAAGQTRPTSIIKLAADRPLAPPQVLLAPPTDEQRAVNPPDAPDPLDPKAKKKKSILAAVEPTKTAAPVAGTGGVTVTTADEVERPGGNALIHDLDKKEREKLISERIVVKDTRDDKDVTLAYNVNTPLKLQNPDRTNVYRVLVKPDVFEKCLVVFGPYTYSGARIFCTVVSLDSKRWINTHPSHVWTLAEGDDEAFRDWIEKLPEATSLPTGGLQLLLMPGGQGTCPFSVSDDYDDEIYDVNFRDHSDSGQPFYQSDYPRDYRTQDGGPWHGSRIRLTGHPGRRIRVTDGEVQVPKGARRMTLADNYGVDGGPLQPGNTADMMTSLTGQLPGLKIYSDGRNVSLDESETINKQAALKRLIVGYGLREKAARELLRRAETDPHRTTRCLLKRAAPLGGDMISGAPGAPPFPEPNTGWDPMGANIPTQNQTEFNVQIPDLAGSRTDRSMYQPQGPDPRSMQFAQQAAQTGQREVFDTAMLGSLLKSVRDDSIVDRYMGDLMKGMDRLGRILFLFYWRGEAFEERYGKQDMPELEDGLRNAFENMGEICLFLKKKTVESYPDEGTATDLSNVANQ